MNINLEKVKKMAEALASNIKNAADLNRFDCMLKKLMIERALNTEMQEHLGYEKYHPKQGDNVKNGYNTNIMKNTDGSFALKTSRDREGTFNLN